MNNPLAGVDPSGYSVVWDRKECEARGGNCDAELEGVVTGLGFEVSNGKINLNLSMAPPEGIELLMDEREDSLFAIAKKFKSSSKERTAKFETGDTEEVKSTNQNNVIAEGARIYEPKEGENVVKISEVGWATKKIQNPAEGFETLDEAILFGYRESEDLYFKTASNEEIMFIALRANVVVNTVVDGNVVTETLVGRYFVTDAYAVPAKFSVPIEWAGNPKLSRVNFVALAHTHPNISGQNGFSGGRRGSDIWSVTNNKSALENGMFLRAPNGSVGHMSVNNARTASSGDMGRLVGSLNSFPQN